MLDSVKLTLVLPSFKSLYCFEIWTEFFSGNKVKKYYKCEYKAQSISSGCFTQGCTRQQPRQCTAELASRAPSWYLHRSLHLRTPRPWPGLYPSLHRVSSPEVSRVSHALSFKGQRPLRRLRHPLRQQVNDVLHNIFIFLPYVLEFSLNWKEIQWIQWIQGIW